MWTEFEIRQSIKMNVDQFRIPEFENIVGLKGSHFRQLRESSVILTTNQNAQSEFVFVLETGKTSGKTENLFNILQRHAPFDARHFI